MPPPSTKASRPDAPESGRFIAFTDAVAAIAITLLILPLLQSITSAPGGQATLHTLLSDHIAELGAFALSFAGIFRIWWAHHRIFEHIAQLTPRVVRWSAVWMFAIVLLPVVTAVITAYAPSAATVGLYGGALVLASGSLSALAWLAYRHPEYSGDRPPATRDLVLGNFTVFGAQLLATVIGCTFAGTVNYLAFLLMFLTTPVEHRIKSRWRRG
jgi:uncharacterized membrane protein